MKLRKPKLIPKAGKTLKHAWSVRLLGAAGLLQGAEVVMPWFGASVPERLRIYYAGLTVLVIAAAFASRFVSQKALR